LSRAPHKNSLSLSIFRGWHVVVVYGKQRTSLRSKLCVT
jgi:hypothetical protein